MDWNSPDSRKHWLYEQLKRGFGAGKRVYRGAQIYRPMSMRRTRSIAMKAWKGVQSLRNEREQKYYEAYSSATPSTSGTVISIVQIAHGDDINQREGDKIMVRSINCRFLVTANASADVSWARIAIVYDTRCVDNTAPSVTDIFSSITPVYHTETKNKNRFIVLYDRVVKVSPA